MSNNNRIIKAIFSKKRLIVPVNSGPVTIVLAYAPAVKSITTVDSIENSHSCRTCQQLYFEWWNKSSFRRTPKWECQYAHSKPVHITHCHAPTKYWPNNWKTLKWVTNPTLRSWLTSPRTFLHGHHVFVDRPHKQITSAARLEHEPHPKLLSKTVRPFRLILIKRPIVTIEEDGIHNTVSIDCVTRAPIERDATDKAKGTSVCEKCVKSPLGDHAMTETMKLIILLKGSSGISKLAIAFDMSSVGTDTSYEKTPSYLLITSCNIFAVDTRVAFIVDGNRQSEKG